MAGSKRTSCLTAWGAKGRISSNRFAALRIEVRMPRAYRKMWRGGLRKMVGDSHLGVGRPVD
jgi:hypothetical protein